jgi:hypothetical protein
VSCAICDTRKEKRFCPAVHGRICPQCCGTEREVTLDCPGDCPYLQQARIHEKPRILANLDQSALFPQVSIPQRFLYEHDHLLAGLSYALTRAARADRLINDRDIISVLSAMAKSYETMVNSRLVYETPTANIVHQAIAGEVQKMIVEYRELEKQQTGNSRLKDADILRSLVVLLRLAESRTSGRPKSRAYLDTLFAQFAEKQGIATPGETASRIIIP